MHIEAIYDYFSDLLKDRRLTVNFADPSPAIDGPKQPSHPPPKDAHKNASKDASKDASKSKGFLVASSGQDFLQEEEESVDHLRPPDRLSFLICNFVFETTNLCTPRSGFDLR